MKYWIEVICEMDDEIEADSPDEAFEIMVDEAKTWGDWSYRYEVLEEDES